MLHRDYRLPGFQSLHQCGAEALKIITRIGSDRLTRFDSPKTEPRKRSSGHLADIASLDPRVSTTVGCRLTQRSLALLLDELAHHLRSIAPARDSCAIGSS